MIPNCWYPIEEAAALATKPVALARMGHDLVLWRDGEGRARCHFDRCPHRGVKLSLGRVRDGQLECRYHGFRFDGGGRCTRMPCEGASARIPKGLELDALVVTEVHGLIWLWWGAATDELPEVPWFEGLPADSRAAAGASLEWPINYVRTIESNFDLHHAPFLHKSVLPTLGPRVDPIEAELTDDRLDVTGTMRHEGREDGTAFRISFLAPTLTRIWLGEKLSFIVCDCPIDEHRTWRYARYYVDFVPVPFLGKLIAALLVWFEWVVVQKKQDLPMALTQQPAHPDADADKLVRADVGIAKYLRLRRRLIRAADPGQLPAHVRASLPAWAKAQARLPVVTDDHRPAA